ncbi:MAG: DNA adenine methylase [Coriobacteriia bacterium]|nr:DNA adenine methylase [Coriobacteriia bacterium]
MTRLEQLAISKNPYGITTPLRYPGGKSVIAGHLAEIIAVLNSVDERQITTYVEPYAGGAGAAISLLLNDVVEQIVINDCDVAIHAFWDSIRYRHKDMISLIVDTPVTIDEWNRQRAIYQSKVCVSARDRLELGFATFFLNRTNRSGIIKAGVIGGKSQNGEYKLDARYNKETLVEKIETIAERRRAISVYKSDGGTVFAKYAKKTNAFLYLDPPYVKQGKNLYLNAFSENHHKKLAKKVSGVKAGNWIVTYDNHELIREAYSLNHQYLFELRYSAQRKRQASELLICSDPVKSVLMEIGV